MIDCSVKCARTRNPKQLYHFIGRCWTNCQRPQTHKEMAHVDKWMIRMCVTFHMYSVCNSRHFGKHALNSHLLWGLPQPPTLFSSVTGEVCMCIKPPPPNSTQNVKDKYLTNLSLLHSKIHDCWATYNTVCVQFLWTHSTVKPV